MGIAYKLYEKAAYWALDWGYEGGKEIDRAREKREYDKVYSHIRSCINYKGFDDCFDNMMADARDRFGNDKHTKKVRHYE